MAPIRWHWLIEWTMKHQPHTHMVVWAPADWIFFEVDARVMWLEIAKKHGFECRLTAQDVKRVTSVGWLQYVAKHGAKSVHAAQRENLPAVGWKLPVGSGDMAPALHGLLRPLVSLCALTCPNLRSGV